MRAFTWVVVTFAVVLAIPHVFMPLGRDALMVEVYARAIREGTVRNYAWPSVASPGTVMLACLGNALSATPGRGARLLGFASIFALGTAAAFAFRVRVDEGRSSRDPLPLAFGVLGASWFASAFFDASISGRGEIPANAAFLTAVACVGAPRLGRFGLACAVVSFGAAFALAPKMALLFPILGYVAARRAGARYAAKLAVGCLLGAVAVLAGCFVATGTFGISTLRMSTEQNLPLSIGQFFFHFRPTGAVVVGLAVLVLAVRHDEGAAELRPAIGYVVASFAFGALPWAVGLSRLEGVVGAFTVLTASSASLTMATPSRRAFLPLATFAVAFLGFAAAASNPATKSKGNHATGLYVRRIKDELATRGGTRTREAWLASLAEPNDWFFPGEVEAIGKILDASPRTGTLLVLSSTPEVYAATRRPPAVRDFAAAPPVELPAPLPRWLVVRQGGDGRSERPRGFEPRAVFPHFELLERGEP
jgi:hypothetical protein